MTLLQDDLSVLAVDARDGCCCTERRREGRARGEQEGERERRVFCVGCFTSLWESESTEACEIHLHRERRGSAVDETT